MESVNPTTKRFARTLYGSEGAFRLDEKYIRPIRCVTQPSLWRRLVDWLFRPLST